MGTDKYLDWRIHYLADNTKTLSILNPQWSVELYFGVILYHQEL